MLYLLDANILIDANRDYYSIGRVDEYWAWLKYHSEKGNIKVPREIIQEINKGNDELVKWVKANKFLQFEEDVNMLYVNEILEKGYGPNLTPAELGEIGQDPFLISYGYVNPEERTIVTTEGSKPKKQRQNKKIPDVCKQFGIRSITPFKLIRELDFKTNWHDFIRD